MPPMANGGVVVAYHDGSQVDGLGAIVHSCL